WDAARVRMDWARMEMDLGRLYEASELARQALDDLKPAGMDSELDRARKLYVDLQRRRGWMLDADVVAAQRADAIPVTETARRDDALLDLLLIRIDGVLERRTDAEKKLLAATALFAG